MNIKRAKFSRFIQITYLTPRQMEQLLQFFQGRGIALLFWQKLVPIEMHGVIDLNGEHLPFNVTGDALIQMPPPDPRTGAVPVEIVALELKSIDPVNVAVGLDDPEQWQVTIMLEPVDHTGKLNLIAGQIPNLAFHNVGPNQDTLIADPEFAHEFGVFGCGPWPFHEAVRLHSLGHKHLVNPGPDTGQSPAFVQITHFELGLPLRVPVIPNGFDN